MNLKEIFEKAENGVLTFEQFTEATKGLKLVDLNEGGYVSKKKYEDDLNAKDTQITTLNDTIASRDKDLTDIKAKLDAAGQDVEKLSTLSGDLSTLQSKYDEDVKSYKAQLKKQAYEFAVREFAGSKHFSSQAAKRDFIQSMIAKDLKMEGDKILGADDFVTSYSVDNSDAFVVEKEAEAQPEPQPKPLPSFVSPTQGAEPEVDATGGFSGAFNFTGVRKTEK